MGLALQYVQKTSSGTYHYRRRIPEVLRQVLGKTEFIKKLGDSKAEPLKRYPAIHFAVEKMLAEARHQLSSTKTALDGP